MATITPREHIQDVTGNTVGWIWETSTKNEGTDQNTAVKVAEKDDVTITVKGVFDSASVALHGSNDGPSGTFAAITNVNTGSAIAIIAAGSALASESYVWYKPVVTGGAESTQDLDIILVAK